MKKLNLFILTIGIIASVNMDLANAKRENNSKIQTNKNVVDSNTDQHNDNVAFNQNIYINDNNNDNINNNNNNNNDTNNNNNNNDIINNNNNNNDIINNNNNNNDIINNNNDKINREINTRWKQLNDKFSNLNFQSPFDNLNQKLQREMCFLYLEPMDLIVNGVCEPLYFGNFIYYPILKMFITTTPYHFVKYNDYFEKRHKLGFESNWIALNYLRYLEKLCEKLLSSLDIWIGNIQLAKQNNMLDNNILKLSYNPKYLYQTFLQIRAVIAAGMYNAINDLDSEVQQQEWKEFYYKFMFKVSEKLVAGLREASYSNNINANQENNEEVIHNNINNLQNNMMN